METEATTKTPIPIHRESVFYLLSPVFCPTLPSFPDCRRSTNVERALQISPFLQNKPNFKIGNINISIATPKAYAKEQRTMSNERYSKQTQSKPIYRARAARPASQPIDCHPFDCAQARIACNDEGGKKMVYDCGFAIYNWRGDVEHLSVNE